MSGRWLPVVLAVLGTLAACGGDDGAAASGDIEGLVIERIGPYEHVIADVDYDRPAPSGGDHLPSPFWLNCGVYDGIVPDELAVHSLEHGAVWIALGPDSTEADRERAAELAEGRKVIVSDVPDLPNPVELVAWGVRLPLETLADPRAEAFLDELIDAPTAPEAGSACGGGLGDPPTPPELPFG
jgi:hypothetical protein